MTRKQALLRLSQVQFATWELHVYLDTHPNDKAAALRYKQYASEYAKMLSEFEMEFGPITKPAIGNEWLKDPWPWENTKESDC